MGVRVKVKVESRSDPDRLECSLGSGPELQPGCMAIGGGRGQWLGRAPWRVQSTSL